MGHLERVLLFGDDMRIFLSVVRSLGRAGKEVHVVPFDSHAPALASRYVHTVHLLPSYPDDPSVWQAALLKLLQAHSFDLVLPCCDRAILPLHLHRHVFAGYPIAIPNEEAMEVLFDKHRTRELCRELNVPVCDGALLNASDTASDLIERFGLPLAVKPRRSYWVDQFDFRGQAAIVSTRQELDEFIAGIQQPSDYIVEAYFDGVGIGVSVIAHAGELLQAFQHRRLREGRSGSSARVSEAVHEDLRSACAKIAARTKYTGVCMFEFRYHLETGHWVLLETNARFWGTLPLAVSLGADYPLFLYDLLVHQKEHRPFRYAEGIVGRNLGLDGRNLLAKTRKLSARECGSWFVDVSNFLLQPIAWMTGRERSDTFVRDDLRPAFLEFASLLRRLVAK